MSKKITNIYTYIKKYFVYTGSFLIEAEILLFFMLNIFIFWPGALSPDSVSQYYQAASGEYTNWHPPIFSYAWSWMLNFFSGSKGMLLLQLSMLWVSLYLITKIAQKYSKRQTYLLVPLIGLSPQVVSISGVIWKDVHLAYSLLLCSALTLYIKLIKPSAKKRLVLIFMSTISLIYAANLRHNAIFALLPIIYLHIQTVIDEIPKKYMVEKNKIKIFVLAFLAFTGFTYFIVPLSLTKIINVTDLKPGYQIIFDDIYNLSSRDNVVANTKISSDSKKYISTLYDNCPKDMYRTNTLWECKGGDTYFSSVQNDSDELRKLWINSILNKPVEYVRYRIAVYYGFLRSTYPYIWEKGSMESNLYAPTSKINIYTYRFISAVEEDFGFIYRNYLGIVIGTLLVMILTKYKLAGINLMTKKMVSLILLSGVIYALSYLPIVVVSDYRMIYWSTLSASVYLWFIFIVIISNTKNIIMRVRNER